jgi:hypothetical protein
MGTEVLWAGPQLVVAERASGRFSLTRFRPAQRHMARLPSNELTAQLLAHLAEVEARGIHRTMACASLYVYCVYELRMSEDEAQRRCRAARICRQFLCCSRCSPMPRSAVAHVRRAGAAVRACRSPTLRTAASG